MGLENVVRSEAGGARCRRVVKKWEAEVWTPNLGVVRARAPSRHEAAKRGGETSGERRWLRRRRKQSSAARLPAPAHSTRTHIRPSSCCTRHSSSDFDTQQQQERSKVGFLPHRIDAALLRSRAHVHALILPARPRALLARRTRYTLDMRCWRRARGAVRVCVLSDGPRPLVSSNKAVEALLRARVGWPTISSSTARRPLRPARCDTRPTRTTTHARRVSLSLSSQPLPPSKTHREPLRAHARSTSRRQPNHTQDRHRSNDKQR
jgi:hypothetical protein